MLVHLLLVVVALPDVHLVNQLLVLVHYAITVSVSLCPLFAFGRQSPCGCLVADLALVRLFVNVVDRVPVHILAVLEEHVGRASDLVNVGVGDCANGVNELNRFVFAAN